MAQYCAMFFFYPTIFTVIHQGLCKRNEMPENLSRRLNGGVIFGRLHITPPLATEWLLAVDCTDAILIWFVFKKEHANSRTLF